MSSNTGKWLEIFFRFMCTEATRGIVKQGGMQHGLPQVLQLHCGFPKHQPYVTQKQMVSMVL